MKINQYPSKSPGFFALHETVFLHGFDCKENWDSRDDKFYLFSFVELKHCVGLAEVTAGECS